ncbi:MAG: hypothetical protein ACKPKO_09770, partial [Candidatus Fonsibacter sp.]
NQRHHHHHHYYQNVRQYALGHARKREQRVVGTGELAKLEDARPTWLNAMPMSETSGSNASSSPPAEPVILPMPSLTPRSPRQCLVILDIMQLRLTQ